METNNNTSTRRRIEDIMHTTERQVEKIRENLPSILVRARTRMLERENEQLRKMIGK